MLGPLMNRTEKRPCGMCGVKQILSKAHIPPKCAGNELLAKRYRFTVNGHEADAGRGDLGGIYLYGLCAACNTLAGQYDGAYGELANELRPLWVKSWDIALPSRVQLPAIDFDPGAVVRSILLGMCATGDLIYQNWPSLPVDLANGQPLALPPEIGLFLALARERPPALLGPSMGITAMDQTSAGMGMTPPWASTPWPRCTSRRWPGNWCMPVTRRLTPMDGSMSAAGPSTRRATLTGYLTWCQPCRPYAIRGITRPLTRDGPS